MATRKLMIVAGEPSGDALGASLMRAIRTLAGQDVEIIGIGGDQMIAEGLRSLFPMATLSVMGLFEVAPKVPKILSCLRQAEELARAERPDLILTIDSPGFNKRLIKRLKDLDTIRVHYVAPTVWAWRPGRAKKMAALFDHLLVLLPFEPPYFQREGLPTTFVGHPAIEAAENWRGDPRAFRQIHDIPSHSQLVNVLFGSRKGEVQRLGPIFVEALRRLEGRVENLQIVSPTLPHLKDDVARLLARQPFPATVIGADEKMTSFHAANLALAASGTVALETGIAGLPTVVAYRLNAMTAAIAKRLIRIDYANLVNILLEKGVVPELIQDDCRADRIAQTMEQLLTDPIARDSQIEAGALVRQMLRPGSLWPSDKAARVILNLMDGQGR